MTFGNFYPSLNKWAWFSTTTIYASVHLLDYLQRSNEITLLWTHIETLVWRLQSCLSKHWEEYNMLECNIKVTESSSCILFLKTEKHSDYEQNISFSYRWKKYWSAPLWKLTASHYRDHTKIRQLFTASWWSSNNNRILATPHSQQTTQHSSLRINIFAR